MHFYNTKNYPEKSVLFSVAVFMAAASFAQNSVGIGTASPNSHFSGHLVFVE